MKQFYHWLDARVLPWPVKFLTNPLVILFTFFMLIPLIGFANAVVFVLIVNSYMNVTSVGVSSIVLRQTLLVADTQEARAQQDHDAIMAELAEIKQMHLDQAQELTELKIIHKELAQRQAAVVEHLGRLARHTLN